MSRKWVRGLEGLLPRRPLSTAGGSRIGGQIHQQQHKARERIQNMALLLQVAVRFLWGGILVTGRLRSSLARSRFFPLLAPFGGVGGYWGGRWPESHFEGFLKGF